jgi:hypothetical protein
MESLWQDNRFGFRILLFLLGDLGVLAVIAGG